MQSYFFPGSKFGTFSSSVEQKVEFCSKITVRAVQYLRFTAKTESEEKVLSLCILFA